MLGQLRGKKNSAESSVLPSAVGSFRIPMWTLSACVVLTSVALASIIPDQRTNVAMPFEAESQSLTEVFRPLLTTDPWAAVTSQTVNVGAPTSISLNRYVSNVDAVPKGEPSQTPVQTGWGRERRGLIQEATVTPLNPTSMPLLLNLGSPSNFEIRVAYRAGAIERSLFEDARDAGLSDPIILKLAEIFGWDIDFALDIREGDSFVVIYEEKFWFGRRIGEGAVLAAEFSNRGKTYQAIGLKDEIGRVTYFTPTGRNLQRTFLRTPVQFSSVSSSFSKSRYHPILKTWRAHNGVDYSAPAGTPVRATADGKLVSIGWNGGYGNTVIIDHGSFYSTLYAHLSRYRDGLKRGQKIEQGDVIGYVGQTGLATGPHLHYEFQIGGQHQNPLAFRFPEGDLISPSLRDEFLRNTRLWITRLDFISGRHLATR